MFKHSIKLANEGKWLECFKKILDSRWAKQTPKRAMRLSNPLAQIS